MAEPITALGPIGGSERIQALDVARGVAVLGILILNIWAFAGPQAFFDYPLAIADRAGAPVQTWAVVHTLFEGSQRTLLSLLFGAGALLALQRFERNAPPAVARRTYYRRSFLLIAFGLVNAYVLLWPADILFAYGLASLCLYPLRRLPTRWLAAVALLALAIPAGRHLAEAGELRRLEAASVAAVAARDRGEVLDEAAQRDLSSWEKKLAKARPDAGNPRLAGEIHDMQSGSLAQVAVRQARVSFVLQAFVTTNWWFLDALAMMIVGMALCREGLFTRPGKAARHAWMAAGGFAIGLPLALWQTQVLLASDFHPVQAEIAKVSYDLRRFAMAIGWLGLVFTFCSMAGGQAIKRGLAATGRMALTNYLAQSILCALVFYGFGLGLYGKLTGLQLYGVVVPIWALEIAWSCWWLARFRIGPCEWIWRSLTYRHRLAWSEGPDALLAAASGTGQRR
ncbi:MAG: DUF418 domain-containing protein [Gammaproteobacteria bacterium]|nr:DUF418 domain-containing protein [Gammaproteobacteria bacterium]QOJ31040.1 MAG: DUF418 domain-containing protein [Gammaproteobacteria bacterium]